VIGNDGSISLNRQPDEAAKLFWDAVTIAGSTYVEKIQGLQQVIEQLQLANKALSVDPFREVIHGSSEAVYQAMSAADRKSISRYNVQTVLDTVNQARHAGRPVRHYTVSWLQPVTEIVEAASIRDALSVIPKGCTPLGCIADDYVEQPCPACEARESEPVLQLRRAK
jgi:hypothetical protein